MLELVARSNLPPAPRADGTYPVPDANNPFADPQFPFGNPPYAARAYSYVSVAQYEALKAAWYYKYLYNRPAPSKVDSDIQALMPTNDLPAYPSEDAVLSGVTAELMKLLFPAAVEEITLKAAEQREAALLAGKAAASDIAAGVALGQAVAAVFVARAGHDGMRTAGGSPALWQALANAAAARGEMPWKSMDVPARPPMLPAVRQRPGLDDDAGRHRQGAAGSAAVHLVGLDGAGSGRGQAVGRSGDARGARHRQQVGRRPQHPHASWPLEVPGRTLYPERSVQRGAGCPRVRAARHGHARRCGRMLGREVLLLQPASLTHGSRPQVDHRPSELPVVHLGALDVLGGGGRGAVLPVSG